MKNKTIKLSTAVFAAVIILIAGIMSSYVICTEMYRTRLNKVTGGGNYISSDEVDRLTAVASVIKQYSYYEVDEESLAKSLINGFIDVKGDRYAYYYTAEELAQMTAENQGDMEGIGVSIIFDEATGTIKIISVFPDSPAKRAGLQSGDLIVEVKTDEGTKQVADIGYENAIGALKGVAGTYAEFGVSRSGSEEILQFRIAREHVTTLSVYYHVYDGQIAGKKAGVVRITGFDLTTPGQFCTAMDDLIKDGCEYFIFDVRYNPGGDLQSIKAVLSYFLNPGDKVIRVRDRDGNESSDVAEVTRFSVESGYSGCSVSAAAIGKYREAAKGKSVVLANGYTASAGELFTSAMQDYKIAQVVGEKTYGKGSMQSIITLDRYGLSGAVKVTTRMYFPPLSEGYDGIGITPDLEVPLAEELQTRNYLDVPDKEDNQMTAAAELLAGAQN